MMRKLLALSMAMLMFLALGTVVFAAEDTPNGIFQAEDLVNQGNAIGCPGIVSDRIPNGEVTFGGDTVNGVKISLYYNGTGTINKTLTVRHVKGFEDGVWYYKALEVFVNGVKDASLVLPYTSWSSFENYDIPLTLVKGQVNDVILCGGSSGYDYFEIKDRASTIVKTNDPEVTKIQWPAESTHNGIFDLWNGGDYVNGFSFNVNGSGVKTLRFTYITGFTPGDTHWEKQILLKVNDIIVKKQPLPQTTDSWSGFKTIDFDVYLPNSTNVIKFVGGSVGVNRIEILDKPNYMAQIYQAEDPTVCETNIPIADNVLSTLWPDNGTFAKFTIDVPFTGDYEIKFGYSKNSFDGGTYVLDIPYVLDNTQNGTIAFFDTAAPDWKSFGETTTVLNLTKGSHTIQIGPTLTPPDTAAQYGIMVDYLKLVTQAKEAYSFSTPSFIDNTSVKYSYYKCFEQTDHMPNLIVCYYNGNELLNVAISEIDTSLMQTGIKQTATINLDIPLKTKEVKAFAWNGLNQLVPLTVPQILTLQ